MTKRILLGLIIVTTVTFSFVYMASQNYLIAALAFGVGLIWLTLEHYQAGMTFSTLFFLFFVGLAILGSLIDLSEWVMLLGLSTDLAAWDLSRFRARVTYADKSEIQPLLETKHLQRLFPTIGIGFLIALLPIFVELSANFVAFLFLTLLAVIVLRASVLNLRREHKSVQG